MPVKLSASFKSVNNEEFDALLDKAVDIILSSERIIFAGAGNLIGLAKYGARFSNIGKSSNHIDDPISRSLTTWLKMRWPL